VVETTNYERRRFWSIWTGFLDTHYPCIRHDLSDIDRPKQLALLGAYAEYVRLGHGNVSNGQGKCRTQKVELALRAISQTLELDGMPSPVLTSQGTYPLSLKRQLDSYRKQDPPTKSKLALPFSVLEYLQSIHQPTTSQRQQATVDLCIIAWFYLLRVGEYTRPRTKSTQTTPIRVCDITFWNNTTTLPHTLPLELLLHRCTSATIQLDNQKNGKRNATIHQQATRTDVCPVKALIRRVVHIRLHTTNTQTLIGTYFSPSKPHGWIVTATDINTTLKNAVTSLGLARFNIAPGDISSHSLRAGGAMALHLNGVPDRTIQILGRWSSDTFLIYIHQQIAAFSHNLSTLMSKNIIYHNIYMNPILRSIE
jgi:hypothetical protein